MVCQPSQTSSSCFGSRLSARISVISSMSRQSSPAAPPRAVLAAAVRAFHRRHQPRQLLRFLRIRRRRHRQRRSCSRSSWRRSAGETCTLCRTSPPPSRTGRRADERLVRLRGHHLGVGRDVGVLDPARAIGGVAEEQQLLVHLFQECDGVIGQRRRPLRTETRLDTAQANREECRT